MQCSVNIVRKYLIGWKKELSTGMEEKSIFPIAVKVGIVRVLMNKMMESLEAVQAMEDCDG